LARRLAAGRSRRSVLRGLVGGGTALVAMKTGPSLAAPAEKVTICHWDAELGAYALISVSGNAVAAHAAHELDIVDPDLTTITMCGDCNTACQAVDACTPAACTDDGCNTEPACIAVDTCTEACDEDGCITTSACDAVANSSCVDGNCACDEGYTENEAGQCVLECLTLCGARQDACLLNGSCAETCIGGCPGDCGCSFPNTEGSAHCVTSTTSCDDMPQICASTQECLIGYQCQLTDCGDHRCAPLCGVIN
jgi:hypothetical protein